EPLAGLSRDQDVDRQGLLIQLKTARLELTELRRPFTEPMFYMGAGSELDVSSYLKRPYAPLGERLAALRRHLAGYSGYLEAARDNLEAASAQRCATWKRIIQRPRPSSMTSGPRWKACAASSWSATWSRSLRRRAAWSVRPPRTRPTSVPPWIAPGRSRPSPPKATTT